MILSVGGMFDTGLVLTLTVVFIGLFLNCFKSNIRPFTKEEVERWNRRIEYNRYHGGREGGLGIYLFPMVMHRGPHDIYVKRDPVLKRDVYLIAKNGPVKNWI